jgi:N-acetyl-1-D-myo-inositol-2-amino-2-deoxy-alpha-D-glucopyranoside deacetylase
MSEGRMRESLRQLRESGDTTTFEGMEPDGDLPFVTADDLISTRIDGARFAAQKMRALAAHATQVEMDGPFFSGGESSQAFWAEEAYRIVRGRAVPDDDGYETDLFAGL